MSTLMRRHTLLQSAAPSFDYPALIASLGATHHWPCDETSGTTVADAIGSLDLTLSGTYTLGVSSFNGDARKCIQFGGGHAQAAGLAWGDGNPRPLTLGCWVKPTAAEIGVILDQRDSAYTNSNGSLQYRGSEATTQFRHDKYPPTASQIGTGSYALNNCYFFLYEEQAGSRKIWINNVLAASDASPENYTGYAVSYTAIGSACGGGAAFTGLVKDVFVIPAVLSSTERDSLWNGAKP